MSEPGDPKTEEQARVEELAQAARRKTTDIIARNKKLIKNLRGDLERHGDPVLWKRYGDLILANLYNAIREDDSVLVTDFFDENIPTIRIAGDKNRPLNEIAEGYFRRYTKARNGLAVISERLQGAEKTIAAATEILSRIDAAEKSSDTIFLMSLVEPPRQPIEVTRKKKKDVGFKGARCFVSSDGFEILVGKKANDNDFLTFRVAKSLDLWLHAADYPGSHVVVRNPNRKEIPNRTLLEAAQLAAFYSSGREQPKAAVNYTQKKFVNKPRHAAPGMVSLAKFRTIVVEPKVAGVERFDRP